MFPIDTIPPMVILIGGSSHVGKTLFAQKLLERIQYPYISLDHLKMAFIRTGKTDLTVEDDYEMRYFLFPFAAEIIKTAIENHQNLIVEGCYIPETWRTYFSEQYWDSIRCVFIVMSESYLRDHFSDVVTHANAIENRLDDQPDLERLIQCSKEFKEACIEYDIPCLEITDSFDADLLTEKIVNLLALTE